MDYVGMSCLVQRKGYENTHIRKRDFTESKERTDNFRINGKSRVKIIEKKVFWKWVRDPYCWGAVATKRVGSQTGRTS